MSRILVVEDEMLIAESIAAMLSDLGHTVTGTLETTSEALRSVEDDRPDLAIVDVSLRGEPNGVALARELARSGIKVVFCTGGIPTEAGFADIPSAGVLIKPFSREHLTMVVRLALAEHTT